MGIYKAGDSEMRYESRMPSDPGTRTEPEIYLREEHFRTLVLYLTKPAVVEN
jgi:hypothetical protein